MNFQQSRYLRKTVCHELKPTEAVNARQTSRPGGSKQIRALAGEGERYEP